jgi:hypothetical protein
LRTDPNWLKTAKRAGLVTETRVAGLCQVADNVPLPPSTNNLFLTTKTGKRVKTPQYRAWIEAATPILGLMAPPPRVPCEVWITVRGKINPRSDVANREKAVTDLLVAEGVLPGDSVKYVVGSHQVYRPDEGEPRVSVHFEEVEG